MGDTVCAKRGTEQKLKACDRRWFTNDTTVQISTFLVNVVPSFHYTLKMIYYKLISAESLYRDFIVDIGKSYCVVQKAKAQGPFKRCLTKACFCVLIICICISFWFITIRPQPFKKKRD